MKAASDAKSGCRAALVLTPIFLLLLHIGWQTWLVARAPFPARYDYDEGVYAETASASAAGSGLYSTIFLSQPPLLVSVLAHTFVAFGRSLASARGAIVAFSALWLAALAALTARAAGTRAMPWAVALAASAPAFVAASHSVQMEAPGEALAALSVAVGFAAVGAHRGGTWPAGVLWALSGFVGGLAAMTKYTALACFAPLFVVVASDPTAQAWTRAWRGALLAAGALLGAAATLIYTHSAAAEMWRQTVVFHGAVAAATPLDLGRPAALLASFAAANWFMVALALGGLVLLLPSRRRSGGGPEMIVLHAGQAAVLRRAIVAWLVVEIAGLVAWRPVWPHHFVILMTPLTVLAATFAEAVWRRADYAGGRILDRPRWMGMSLPRLAFAVVWFVTLMMMIGNAGPGVSQVLQAVAAETESAVPPAAQVVTDDPLVAFLAHRDVPPMLCDTSEMRMRAGWLTVPALQDSLRDPRVRGVVLWRGVFQRMAPGFVDDATNRFPRRWSAGPDRLVLAR